MLFDSVSHIETYHSLDPRIYRGLQLLTADVSQLPDGKYPVDGDNLFYLIQTYKTRPENDLAEAHRKYVDIQCTLSGKEVIAVGPVEKMTQVEAHPEKDLWLYHGSADPLTILPGRFVVLWPQDAHAAMIAVNQPTTCRKIVVKVRID